MVDGKEDDLPDAEQLDELGLGEGSVVFMLNQMLNESNDGPRTENSRPCLMREGVGNQAEITGVH
jgi:hypothetical protein